MILKQRDQQSENEYEGSMFIIGVLSARKQANKSGNERQTAAQMLQKAAECCKMPPNTEATAKLYDAMA